MNVYSSRPARPAFDAFVSYVNANAVCPICSAPVFFYQSPYGGRVFFDTLFPDWDKHPCTDNREYSYGGHILAGPARPEGGHAIPQWQTDGWQPLEILRVYREGEWWVISAKMIENGEPLRLLVHGKPSIEPGVLAAFCGWSTAGVALLSNLCKHGDETNSNVVYRYIDHHSVRPGTDLSFLCKLLKKDDQ